MLVSYKQNILHVVEKVVHTSLQVNGTYGCMNLYYVLTSIVSVNYN